MVFGAIFIANFFCSIRNKFCSQTFFCSICTIFYSCFHANNNKNNNNKNKASFRTFEQISQSKSLRSKQSYFTEKMVNSEKWTLTFQIWIDIDSYDSCYRQFSRSRFHLRTLPFGFRTEFCALFSVFSHFLIFSNTVF